MEFRFYFKNKDKLKIEPFIFGKNLEKHELDEVWVVVLTKSNYHLLFFDILGYFVFLFFSDSFLFSDRKIFSLNFPN